MNFQPKVLFLSAWYPSKINAIAGLFVQKHVCAVTAQGAEVRVNTIWPRADIVQLNVISLKWGMVALLMKWLLHIPFIIVEHWSAYLPANGQFGRFPIWKQRLMRLIAKNASGIYPVSKVLEDSMKRLGIHNKVWGRMENVVDDFFFDTLPENKTQHEKKRLLHVSCFDEKAKNIKGLLRAVREVADYRQDFVLTLVGRGKDWQNCFEYARELQFPQGMVEWTGELSPEGVSDIMHESDAFLFFSRYENAPVVLSECLASGLPIVSSRAGGIPEMVSEESGILVDVEDETAFANAVNYMLDHYQEYDTEAMRQSAAKFSSEAISRKLIGIYDSVLEDACVRE